MQKNGIASFDIDMTLLDHRTWSVPDSAKRAIARLRERYYIVIASGRNMHDCFGEGLCEEILPDALVHMNGAYVTVGDKVLYEHWMEPELVKSLLDFTQGKQFSVGVSLNGVDYFMNPEFVERHDVRRWGESRRNFGDPYQLLKLGTHSMVYIGVEEELKELRHAFPTMKFPMFSSREGADMIEAEMSKSAGLKRLCEYFCVPLSNTVAFGDSMNDYEIVRDAGIGVAMGNAVEDLKRAADYVTTDIGEDGIWNACVNLHLIDE